MSRRAALVLLAVAAACGDREVIVRLLPQEYCPGEEPACPLEAVGSLLIELERTSGELLDRRCWAPPDGLCDYEDLQGETLIEDLPPVAGLEVRLEGFSNDVCLGAGDVFCCDSGSGYLVDLSSEVFPVDVWCSCAPRDAPCPE